MGCNGKRRVVVTGGSSGIGLGIARHFAEAGGDVVIIGRDAGRLEQARAQIRAEVRIEAGDVASLADVERMTRSILAHDRSVDLLVNNAGVLETVPIGTPLPHALATYRRVLDAGLTGAFLMSHALAPALRSPGGRIVNMGSIVAHTGASVPGYTAYAACKAGLHGLTLALARELGPRGITVNTVAPGFTAGTGQTEGWDEARTAPILARIPLGRAGQVSDIVAAVAFLASPESGYVTGMTLPVNGGWQFYS